MKNVLLILSNIIYGIIAFFIVTYLTLSIVGVDSASTFNLTNVLIGLLLAAIFVLMVKYTNKIIINKYFSNEYEKTLAKIVLIIIGSFVVTYILLRNIEIPMW